MIYRVDLTNFGPHTDFHAVLQPGINLFLGENGSGKSNIVYAIGWAILGPRALPPAYTQADIIHDGASEAAVTVELDFVGRRLAFSRSYNGKVTRARIVDAATNEVLADNATGVTEFLSRYGFDWDAASVPFCRQRDLDAFVHESPANRKKIIASLLQLENLDNAVKYVRQKKQEIPPFQDEPDIKKLKLRVDATEADHAEALGALKQAEIKALVAEQELSQATLALPTDDHQDERAQAQQTLTSLLAEAALIERQLVAIKIADIEDPTKEIESLDRMLKEARSMQEQWGEEVLRLDREARDAESRQDAFVVLVDSLTPGCNCPVCRSPVTADTAQAVKADATECQPVDRSALAAAVTQRDMATSNLQTLLGQKKKLEEQLRSFQRVTEARKEWKAQEERLATLQQQVTEAKERLASIPDPPTKGNLENVQSLARLHQAAEREVLNWEREVTKTAAAGVDAATDYKRAKDLIASQAEYRALSTTIKSTESALKTFRDQLLRGALTWVSGRATQVLQSSGDMAVAPAGSRLELDEKLVYSVVLPDGTSQPVYRVSGGQAAVFSTCLRIALSEYLAGRMGMDGLLLLDAIFEPMNEENRAIAAQAIQAYGPPQTLLFSYFPVSELDAHVINVA